MRISEKVGRWGPVSIDVLLAWWLLLRHVTCQSRLDPTSQLCPPTWTQNSHKWTIELAITSVLRLCMLWWRLQYIVVETSVFNKVFSVRTEDTIYHHWLKLQTCNLVSSDAIQYHVVYCVYLSQLESITYMHMEEDSSMVSWNFPQ